MTKLLYLGGLIFFFPLNYQIDIKYMAVYSKGNVKATFIGQLTQIPPMDERCGDDAIAAVFLFKVLNSVQNPLDLKEVNLVIPCPETLGNNFFQPNKKYKIEAIKDSPEYEVYKIANAYEINMDTTFWMLKIEKYD
jgi:hypothetical protein